MLHFRNHVAVEVQSGLESTVQSARFKATNYNNIIHVLDSTSYFGALGQLS